MRKPFQSLRSVLGVSAAGVGGLIAFAAVAQEAPAAPVATAEPTRPPDCLDCGTAPSGPVALITNPTWARRPTPEYPARAMAAGISQGRVTVTCAVKPDGTLSGCQVVAETPAGAGFGPSALAAAAAGRLSPQSLEAAVAGSRVSFSINYLLPDAEPVASPPGARR